MKENLTRHRHTYPLIVPNTLFELLERFNSFCLFKFCLLSMYVCISLCLPVCLSVCVSDISCACVRVCMRMRARARVCVMCMCLCVCVRPFMARACLSILSYQHDCLPTCPSFSPPARPSVPPSLSTSVHPSISSSARHPICCCVYTIAKLAYIPFYPFHFKFLDTMNVRQLIFSLYSKY